MNWKAIIGAILLVAGIVLLVMGLVASDSLADQVSKVFTGKFTESTTAYIIGGIAASVGGVLLLAGGRTAKTA